MPQYLLLIDGDPAAADAADQQATMEEWFAYTEQLGGSGAMRGGNALEPAETATTVRVRDGETIVSDGPFAETEEILGGYYLIDVPDLDAALG